MPLIKRKRVKNLQPVATKRVLVRKPAPKVDADCDNVATSNRAKVINKVKARPAPKAAVDTDVVDTNAKAYTIELEDGDSRTVRGYVVTAVGPVLGTTGVTATRWEKSGMLPKPIFATGRGAIYHVEEVRSFYRLLTEHQQDHKQYRAEHADLRRRLFSENARIRRGLFPK